MATRGWILSRKRSNGWIREDKTRCVPKLMNCIGETKMEGEAKLRDCWENAFWTGSLTETNDRGFCCNVEWLWDCQSKGAPPDSVSTTDGNLFPERRCVMEAPTHSLCPLVLNTFCCLFLANSLCVCFRAFLGIPFCGGDFTINLPSALWGCWSRWKAITRWVSDPGPSTANPQSHSQHGRKVCCTPSREGSKRSLVTRLKAKEKNTFCEDDLLRRGLWGFLMLPVLPSQKTASQGSLEALCTLRQWYIKQQVLGRSKRSWRMHEETWRFRACIRHAWKFKVWLLWMIPFTALDLGRRSETLSSRSCRGLLFTNRDQWNDESWSKERTRWEGDVFAWAILAFVLEAFVYFNQTNGSSAYWVLADEFMQRLKTNCLPPGICHPPAWRRTGR